MISWLFNLVYLSLLVVASPILIYRCVALGKYRQGWSQKFLGRLPERTSERRLIWFHAVSVGETLLLKPILDELRKHDSECDVLITTTTHTGQAVAREKYPDCQIAYMPLDFSWSVKTALLRVRPDLLVLVELELWPNLIREASRQNIPLAIVNGRLSEKSFRGYRKIRFVVGGLLKRMSLITSQSETYTNRFRELGAEPSRLVTTGSVKFDQVETDRNNARTIALRKRCGIRDEDVVFIAGSTQHPEEDYAIRVWKELKDEFPQLKLILVPRHQERFEEVASLLQAHDVPFARRSQIENSTNEPVILLDTLGELDACWGLAEVAFVGGSLTNRGGQNMIEPAAYGAAVLFGPNTWNFRDVVLQLLDANAARVVNSREELQERVSELLRSPELRTELGTRARNVVIPQQGATKRTIECLLSIHAASPIPGLFERKAA